MKTTTSNHSIALTVGALLVAATAAFAAFETIVRPNAASASAPVETRSVAGTPNFEYARLVVTAAPQSTLVWINTPLATANATLTKGGDGTLESVQSAIRATSPESGFDELSAGRPMDDMMLVQWMGVAHWELVAVTQDQIDQGSTTSLFFKRLK